MPYTGAQSVACHTQASTCLKAGFTPRWPCEDWYYDVWSGINTGESKIIPSTSTTGRHYETHCGPPLSVGEPTSIREAEEMYNVGSYARSSSPRRSVTLPMDGLYPASLGQGVPFPTSQYTVRPVSPRRATSPSRRSYQYYPVRPHTGVYTPSQIMPMPSHLIPGYTNYWPPY